MLYSGDLIKFRDKARVTMLAQIYQLNNPEHHAIGLDVTGEFSSAKIA